MPLLVVYGKPCSGKSRIVDDFVNYLGEKYNMSKDKIKIIRDSDNGQFSTNIYDNSKMEKDHRCFLKSSTDESLKKDILVILDSLNYIKGYRYELHCIAKKSETKFSLLTINEDDDKCLKMNLKENQRYDERIIKEIFMRMELPNQKDFWDNPNVVINSSTSTTNNTEAFEKLYINLFEGASLVSNKSTQVQPISNRNFVTDIAKITKKIILVLDSEQSRHKFGDRISLPHTDIDEKDENKNRYLYIKRYSINELDRCRKVFLGTIKGKPIEGVNMIGNLFVNYLNTHLSICHVEGDL
uniref:Protein KTI12 homolog n=1 Tax=Parastrongyloides trichosuri TaxID=131310 RepID=A0A0N4ZI71_PARTI